MVCVSRLVTIYAPLAVSVVLAGTSIRLDFQQSRWIPIGASYVSGLRKVGAGIG